MWENGTYTYDDGSTVTQTAVGVSSTPATDNGVYGWSVDRREAEKLGQFYGGDKPWWEQAAVYGVTRAIDSHFRRTETDKTAAPATFAGQNGATYQAGSTAPMAIGGSTLLMLAAVAAAAYALTR